MKPRVYVETTLISYLTARRAAVRDAADFAIALANNVDSWSHGTFAVSPTP